MNGEISADILKFIESTDCLHCESGLKIRAENAAFTRRWKALFGGEGGAVSREVTGTAQKNVSAHIKNCQTRRVIATNSTSIEMIFY